MTTACNDCAILVSAARRAALLEAVGLLRRRAARWRTVQVHGMSSDHIVTDADAAADEIKALAERVGR